MSVIPSVKRGRRRIYGCTVMIPRDTIVAPVPVSRPPFIPQELSCGREAMSTREVGVKVLVCEKKERNVSVTILVSSHPQFLR